MKKKIMMLLWIVMSSPTILMAQGYKGIAFLEDIRWSAILEKAKKEHKYIFVDAYTTWCGPCKMMDRDVYSNEQVGLYINANFIAVKVQMDSTKEDKESIIVWRKDATSIAQQAKIDAYPTLLFFSPDGQLAYKSVGYKSALEFVSVAKFAGNPNGNVILKRQLLDYQNGKKDYKNMSTLSKMTSEVLADNKLALQIAIDYKKNYLDKLSQKDFLNAENLAFIRSFGASLLDLNDNLFKACYDSPGKVDSLIGKGSANLYSKSIISIREVKPRLYKDKKPLTNNPSWKKLTELLKRRYTKINVDDLILDEKVNFYRSVSNWVVYSNYLNQQLKVHPPSSDELEVYYRLNHPAWDAFLHCSDHEVLKKALQWSSLSIKLTGSIDQFMDTKANILYKLGRLAEAISLEEKIVKMEEDNAKEIGQNPNSSEFQETLVKMKKGIPTW
ncbi:Thioredoxin-like [Mucilaginibacter pineti]|uniref:Thioredoxin-like n=1 Tax=Mucilaginibacter pineti TaxID=1391627 RepID=A0A1G7GA93_9SPHI|nr:thioredoxin family protein [Mucilaginibacter pineti]SDE85068.1 Thioredoxin-like [Mucilaginibacter pineti]